MKANHLIAILILLATVLSMGCSRDEQPVAEPTQSKSKSASSERPPSDGARGRALETALPDGAVLSFAYHMRGDTVEEVNPGEFQRRLRIEHFESSRQRAIEAITADLVRAGYKAGTPKEIRDDRTRINFRHRDGGRMVVTVLENVGLSHASSTGLIYIHIPMEDMPVDNGSDIQE